MAPSLGLINVLEWLTELREAFYSLDHQFIINEYNSGTARWKRSIGQGMWEGGPPSQHLQVFTNLEAL